MSSRPSDSPAHALGVRLATWYACLFVGSSLAIAAVTYLLLASSLRQRDRELVQSTLLNYATQYTQGGVRALDRAIRTDQAASRHEALFVRVLDADRELVFFSQAGEWSDFDLSQLGRADRGNRQWWASVPGRRAAITLEVASAVLPDGTLLQVGKSTETRDEMLARFRTTLLVTLTLIVLAGVVGGTALTRSTMAPLRELAEVVQTILETGRFETRVPVSGTRDPLDRLGGLFNAMLDRIGALVAGMRGSLDNVAHDLRTPMTRLRTTAERALEEGPANVERYRDALADCLEESDRVSQMLNTLMDISEAETGVMKLEIEPLEVAEALRDGLDLYADVAEDRGVELRLEVPSGLRVTADRNRLRQVIANLLDNAVKYTPSGGHVVACARGQGDEVAIEIADTGSGIAADDLPRIWDRLYRGDRSRSERGLGLGLSLVRAVVQAHNGRVEARSTPGAGSTFTVYLPRA